MGFIIYIKKKTNKQQERKEKKIKENGKEEISSCGEGGGVAVGAEWIYIKKNIYFYLYIKKKTYCDEHTFNISWGSYTLFFVGIKERYSMNKKWRSFSI